MGYTTLMAEFRLVESTPVESQPLIRTDSGPKKHALLILKAASVGDAAMLEQLLLSLQAVHTPLIHAAMCRAASRGHLLAFKTLARYSQDIHADDPRRATNAVISSMIGGHYEVLDFILAHGGDIDRATQSGRTALSTAVTLGRWDLLELTISRGADVNKAGAGGRTALCLATTLDRYDLVELLLHYGAAPNCGCHCCVPGRFDRFHCALDVAALKGNEELVSLLRNYGAFFFRESDLFLPVLVSLLRRGSEDLARRLTATIPDLNASLENQHITPLCLAVQRSGLSVIRFLVSMGANIHISSPDGPPLCYAVFKDDAVLVKWLLYNGAQVNAPSETYGTALHAAVGFGYINMVDLLLRNGADVFADSPRGRPLAIARYEWNESCTSERQRRFEGIVELLGSAGASDEDSQLEKRRIYEADSAYESGSSDGDSHGTWFDWN